MRGAEKPKGSVLLILSKMYSEFIMGYDTATFAKRLQHECHNVDVLVDPSRTELELLLQKKQYICIIPCTPFSLKSSYASDYLVHNFSIFQLLQKLDFNYFGSSHMTNLMLHDKAASLKLSKMGPTLKVVTRYQHKRTQNVFEDFCFPIILESIYSENLISRQTCKATSIEDAQQVMSTLFFDNKNLDEILAQENPSYSQEVVVTIIGNPPLSTHLIHEKDTSDQETNACESSFCWLIAKSYELFELYGLQDFGQFRYIRNGGENSYVLVDINCCNCMTDTVMVPLMQQYEMNPQAMLNLFVTIFLVRQRNSELAIEYLSKLIPLLPEHLLTCLLPLEFKMRIFEAYDYKDICRALGNRFLKPDESNRFDFMKLLGSALRELPKVDRPDAVLLGKSEESFLMKFNSIPLYPKDQQDILRISIKALHGQIRWHAPSMLYNVNPPVMFSTVAASAITNLYNPNVMAQKTSAALLSMEKQIAHQMAELVGWDKKETAGIFTSGGKVCIMYAIKCGLNRCLRSASSSQMPVVISSEINHFSIESSCFQLGLPRSSCLRVPVDASGTIDFSAFETILVEILSNDIPIACVIFSGGNTTHCAVENIKQGKAILDRLTDANKLCYDPFIYYDLVVGWPWLFFKQYDFSQNKLNIESEALYKIRTVTEALLDSHLADAVGIDFHKGGFAPFSNSMFCVQKSADLYAVSDGNAKEMFREPYHYIFCNSRGATDILSAWNVLQSVGVQGFQSYVANMVHAATILADQLPLYGFEVLDKDKTYGFATIIWARAPQKAFGSQSLNQLEESQAYMNDQYLYKLTEYWKQNHENVYYVRFLPKYRTISKTKYVAVISLLSMTIHMDEQQAVRTAHGMGRMKQKFDQLYLLDQAMSEDVLPEEVPK